MFFLFTAKEKKCNNKKQNNYIYNNKKENITFLLNACTRRLEIV